MYDQKNLDKEGDQFPQAHLSQIVEDLKVIGREMAASPAACNKGVPIPFCRDHSMESEWASGSPDQEARKSTKPLRVKNPQALSDSPNRNPLFREQLESYIRACLAE